MVPVTLAGLVYLVGWFVAFDVALRPGQPRGMLRALRWARGWPWRLARVGMVALRAQVAS